MYGPAKKSYKTATAAVTANDSVIVGITVTGNGGNGTVVVSNNNGGAAGDTIFTLKATQNESTPFFFGDDGVATKGEDSNAYEGIYLTITTAAVTVIYRQLEA